MSALWKEIPIFVPHSPFLLHLLKRPLGELADHLNTRCLVALLFISTIVDFGTIQRFLTIALYCNYDCVYNCNSLLANLSRSF